LNTNSIIVYPKHEEWLDMKNGVAKYKLKGYAYTGGGRKIARVELTFDQGTSWVLSSKFSGVLAASYTKISRKFVSARLQTLDLVFLGT